jgi:RNA polymerase sigma-70 factor, ECF subfamily
MRTGSVERAMTGDQTAFSELVDLEGDACFAIAVGILRDVERAEDAVQQTFLLAWRDLRKLRDPDRFQAWLRRILVRACYQEARRYRQWSSRIRVLPADGPNVPTQRDQTIGIAERDALEQAFTGLSPEQRAVVVLHHQVGLTLAEVAVVVGAPVGTVKSRLHYATTSLRTAILAADPVQRHEELPA